jgi:two-component system sensor histidine kinase KdpD
MALKKEWVEPRELVGRAARQLKEALRPFKLRVDVPLSLPTIKGDPILLEQTLVNILDNAAKYAPPGSEIAVTAERRDETLRMVIDDEGPGIPEEDRERIFDMFYRVRTGDAQSKGTGLGLAIARGILDAHGGSIRALSAGKGHGTRIELSLPLSGAAAKPARKADAA